jgi:hypothetical protein
MKWHRGWIIGATVVGLLFLLHIDLSAQNGIALGKLFDIVLGSVFLAWCVACILDGLWELVPSRRMNRGKRQDPPTIKNSGKRLVLPPGEPVKRLAKLEGKPEPHWAVAVLLDPRVPLVEFVENELVREHDYVLDADPEKALAGFDETIEGWVPWWFPHRMHPKRWTEVEDGVDLTPPQRLDWFDRALAYYAQSEYPPPEPLSLMKRTIALSMIQMLCRAEQGKIPGADQTDGGDLAKVAADWRKENGLTPLPPEK